MDFTVLKPREICLRCPMPECNSKAVNCGIKIRKAQMDAKFYLRHRERICSRVKSNYKKNPAKVKRRVTTWKSENRDLVCYQQQRYRSKKQERLAMLEILKAAGFTDIVEQQPRKFDAVLNEKHYFGLWLKPHRLITHSNVVANVDLTFTLCYDYYIAHSKVTMLTGVYNSEATIHG